MKTVSLNNVAKIAADMDGAKGAWRQLPIGVADGTPTQSFRVFTLEPAGHTPCHTHEWEHLNYIIAGQGALMDADGQEHPIVAGDFAIVLPWEKHQYRNTSDSEPFVMICAVPKEYE